MRSRWFVIALWLAFLCRGAFHTVLAPMWNGFDEPGHLAYIAFVAEHGRPPGYQEPSFPRLYVETNRYLPSHVGNGAPSFPRWRSMTAEQRETSRAMAARVSTSMSATTYISANYERQQGPLFYYLAAPFYLAVRHMALPKIVVALRLFCILLASLTIPLSARLLRLGGGSRAVLLGLPIVALLPNTPFAVDRISNEALTWPLSAAIAMQVVLFATRRERRDAIALGILTAAGVWTKLTLLPFVAACAWFAFAELETTPLVINMLTTAVLLGWNKEASGSFSGLIEATEGRGAGWGDLPAALERLRSLPVIRELVKNHLWSGGWGFVKPPDLVYGIALIILMLCAALAFLSIRRRGAKLDGLRLVQPFIMVVAVALLAQGYHIVTAAMAAIRSPGFPTIGAEGWYLDAFRPIEALLVAIVGAAAIPPRWTRAASAVLIACLAALDLMGTSILMLPNWAGFSAPGPLSAAFRGAIAAAPIHRYAFVPLALALGWIIACAAAGTVILRSDSDEGS
jgi:hypothetical protein